MHSAGHQSTGRANLTARLRELNPYKTGEPKTLPVGVALTDEQMDKLATIVAAKLKEAA